MKAAVVYYSRSGNTKAFADAIAKGAGTEAISCDSENAFFRENVETLFIGGALYAYGLDIHLKEYLKRLDASKIGKAVVFSTSWISKHSIDLIKNSLKEKGIEVVEESLYAKSNQVSKRLSEAEEFGRKYS